jgi:Cupredoxin-like domain
MRLSRIRFYSSLAKPRQPQQVPMPRLGLLVLALIFDHATSAMAQDAPYTLIIKDHKFQPTEIEIPADKKITLIVKNQDLTPEEFESIELRREKVVPGGEQITVYIGPLKPGRYEFFGDFNPATARGHIVAK